MKRHKAYMPVGHLGTKRMGELAELAFMFRAASEGIGVARPYGDSHAYDFLVQHGRRLARVQVKSRFTRPSGQGQGYPFTITKSTRGGKTLYSPEEIDFIAAFVAPYQVWYVIPVESLENKKIIRLYPRGKRKRSGTLYETYREAWHLLKEPQNAATERNHQNIIIQSPAIASDSIV
jgi:hypothetical protein